MGFLIDTCIWIDIERGRLTPHQVAAVTKNAPVYLSPVTIAELKFGAENTRAPGLRQQRLAALHPLLRKPILPIDEITAMIYGTLAAELEKTRGTRFRVHDVWIASAALQHHCIVLTQNRKDFSDIPGIKIATPKVG